MKDGVLDVCRGAEPCVVEPVALAASTLVVVGVLGGGGGTTHDAFHIVADAKKHGARVALFGRKIVAAENQLSFVRHLRLVADGALGAKEGVAAYHGDLQKLGLKPFRSLEQDLELTDPVFAYGGKAK